MKACNTAPVRAGGEFVLYWMIAFRRTSWNFGLQRVVEWARELRKPLVIFEPLRVGYRWASDRLHRFVLEGMVDNVRRLEPLRPRGVVYYPYVEPAADRGKGLLEALAALACVVVTDEYPSFFLPRMVRAAAGRLGVRLEQVDSNGLLPLRAAGRVFSTAASFRAFLRKQLRPHRDAFPRADPLAGLRLPPLPSIPAELHRRWPPAAVLPCEPGALARLPIDHSVRPVDYLGGPAAGQAALRRFLDGKLDEYLARFGDHSDPSIPVRA